MFSVSSRAARQTACDIIESMCQVAGRRQEIIVMVTDYLEELGNAGEAGAQYLTMYR